MKTIRIILISSLFFIACGNIVNIDDSIEESSGPSELYKKTTTYWDNGKKKTEIRHLLDGETIGKITCYDSSAEEEDCHPIRHGLPDAYMTVTYFDSPANTKVDNYTQYRDTAKTEKYYEFTYWESNGNKKTEIAYQADEIAKSVKSIAGVSYPLVFKANTMGKLAEASYWEGNGNLKTAIVYQTDGETKKEELTYWESNGNLKTGILYQDDSETKEAETTHWENGNFKTLIRYQTDGETKREELTYWESNGNKKTGILYQDDGETRKAEFTFWENDKEKTLIRYQSDGLGVLSITCFASNSRREICTQAKHGCTSESTTCIN